MKYMIFEGYHNTEGRNVKNILEHGFKGKQNESHWLGQGIYFFADFDTAVDNIDMLKHTDEIKTIAVEISVDSQKYLNLDITRNLNSFRRYCQESLRQLEKDGIEYTTREPNKDKAILKFRCFFLDLYKAENNFAVVSKTFAKENPIYAEPIDNIKYFKFPFLEKYICVSDNEYIIKKNMVEREWLV